MKRFYLTRVLCAAIVVLFLMTGFAFGEDSLFVDANGNVGVGTATPAEKLDVLNGNISVGSTSDLGGNNYGSLKFRSSNGGEIFLRSANSGVTGGKALAIDLQNDANSVLEIVRQGVGPAAYIKANGDALIGGSLQANGQCFFSSVGIGTSNPGSNLEVGTNTQFSGRLIRALGYSPSDADANIEIGDGTGAVYWRLRRTEVNQFRTVMSNTWTITGGTVCATVSTCSDMLYKKDISTIDNALDRITKLRGVNYQWKDKSKGEGPQLGVIAQEVEKVFPEAVSTDSEGYKSVFYSKLVAPLIEAVKELKVENDKIKAENDTLKKDLRAENEMLKKELQELKGQMTAFLDANRDKILAQK